MPKREFVAAPRRVFPPKCTTCNAQMWLTHIEQDLPEHHRRIFECPHCQAVAVRAVTPRQR